MIVAIAAIAGAIFGSFANVLIHRLPRGESISWPPSRCPKCGHRLSGWENVPIASYLGLRGRCLACRGPIAFRYPLVEALAAAAFAYSVARHGLSVQALATATFALLLILIVFIDLDFKIIPDRITFPGMVLGLVFSFATGGVAGVLNAVLAGAGAFAFLLVVAIAINGGMGGGDIKLAGMTGFFAGWPGIGIGLFAGILIGGAAAVLLLITRRAGRKSEVPFGPALALGGFIGIEWGAPLLRAYLQFFGLVV